MLAFLSSFREARLALGTALALGLSVGSPSGKAALIELDSAFGANSITRDMDTGLEWLDLRYTHGFIDEVNARLAPGGDLFGWRRATTEEVVTFWLNAGIPVTNVGEGPLTNSDPAVVAAVNSLMDNLGLWQAHPSVDETHGFTAEAGATPGTWQSAVLRRYWDSALAQYTRVAANIQIELEANPADPCCEPYQNWLVRAYAAQVPEPPPLTLLLLGAGFVGFGIKRRL